MADLRDRRTTALERPSPAPATSEDLVFVRAMRSAGLLLELGLSEMALIATRIDAPSGPARWLDFLEQYYVAGTNSVISGGRIAADRFLLHRDTDLEGAQVVVEKLSMLVPELGSVHVEGHEGRGLSLQAGPLRAPIDHEMNDIQPIAARGEGPFAMGVSCVSIRKLVAALNGLLAQKGLAFRFIALQPDRGKREAFVAVRAREAKELLKEGYLDHQSNDDLQQFTSW